ncbi:MAG: 4'-phosphopantetheinyl transferase family protein [Gemmatimonadota bacterium]
MRPGTALFEVKVIPLDAGDAELSAAAALLSPGESVRAAAQSDSTRRRFTLTRAALRRALGRALELDPVSIAFEYGEHGKPELVDQLAGSVRFNVAHSRDFAVIAITQHSRIGVDLEYLQRVTRLDRIAERYFTHGERESIARLSDLGERRRAFFRVWTRKEAYMKGRGEGISQYLRITEVSADEDSPLLLKAACSADEGRWVLRDIEVPTGYVGAVAVEVGQ